jgi:hypothetical protein
MCIMPLFGKRKNKDVEVVEGEVSTKEDAKEQRKEDRSNKKNEKREYRLAKIAELTEKAKAVAQKRKWLVFLLGLGIAIYFIVSSGGLSNLGGLGGILEKIKGFTGS